MRVGEPRSRRAFLASVSLIPLSAQTRKGAEFASETKPYTDPSTGFEVIRRTDPSHSSWFPNLFCRFVARKKHFLIYGSDRTGRVEAYRLDLKSGASRLLTEEENFDPSTLALLPGDRDFLYFAGDTLYEASLRSLRKKTLWRIGEQYRRGEDFAVSADGKYAAWSESSGGHSRIRLLDLHRKRVSTVLASGDKLRDPVPRSLGAKILYRDGEGGVWIVGFGGENRRRLKLAPGKTGQVMWSQREFSVLYLNFPADRSRLNNIREYFLHTGQDRMVAKTSQFVQFSANADATVFVGASGSAATPFVLLLLRAGGRELTLCEHKASLPRAVKPVFSPDSRWIFFLSDREGRPAIYSIQVDTLVEQTGG